MTPKFQVALGMMIIAFVVSFFCMYLGTMGEGTQITGWNVWWGMMSTFAGGLSLVMGIIAIVAFFGENEP